jgi:hypothetical protein
LALAVCACGLARVPLGHVAVDPGLDLAEQVADVQQPARQPAQDALDHAGQPPVIIV